MKNVLLLAITLSFSTPASAAALYCSLFESLTFSSEASFHRYCAYRSLQSWGKKSDLLVFFHGLGSSPAAISDFVLALGKTESSLKRPVVVVSIDQASSFSTNQMSGNENYENLALEFIHAMKAWYQPVRTFVTGHSMGGFAALKLGLRYPNEFSSGSAFAAGLFPDDLYLPFDSAEKSKAVWSARGFQFGMIWDVMNGVFKNRGYWLNEEPRSMVVTEKIPPFLIMVGDADMWQLLSGNQQIAHRIRGTGGKADFVALPGEGHFGIQKHLPTMLRWHDRRE